MNSPRPLSEARKRALEVLQANPAISEREAAKLARVSRDTVRIVRVEYAAMLPKSPLIIGADGKARQRRRRFITMNGKRKLLRTWVPRHIHTKLFAVARDIADLPNEKERHLAIKSLRGLVREALERKQKYAGFTPDQFTAMIQQSSTAVRLMRGR